MASANVSLPKDFSNIVRLFPLPNVVLFPGWIQALHLFEPRYRQLMVDAIGSDELISMALLKPGGFSGNEHQESGDLAGDVFEPIHPMICIGKIITYTRLEDGRFNLLLAGVSRARIVEEIPFQKPYRLARVSVLQERSELSPSQIENLRLNVIDRFRELLRQKSSAPQEVVDTFFDTGHPLPLGQLCDFVSQISGANHEQQQRVLEELVLEKRVDLVLEMLQQIKQGPSKQSGQQAIFPPPFSQN